MAATKYFKAEVRREADWWTLRVPELGNLTTKALRLLDAEEEARTAIEARLGIGRDAFTVEMAKTETR